jgi:transposase
MNSICLSTDSLPVLGLDVAKKSVQAGLQTAGGKTVRFGFENNAKGFAQLACVLKEHNVPKVCLGRLGSHRTYSHALALWLHGAGHRLSLLFRGESNSTLAAPAIATKLI